jgi:WD40 repeat protein/mono/diheme cytochrome c family protein
MTVVRSFLPAGVLFALVPLLGAAEPTPPPAEVSYSKDVRPLFVQHCQGCHQPAKAQGSYVMTSHADLLKKGDSDNPGVVPGKPNQSEILAQLTPQNGKPPRMPKGKDPLKETDVALIRKWIEQGAKDDTPMTAQPLVDAKHPPVYELQPVVTSLAYAPDGSLLAVSGYHEVLLYKADGSELVARLVGLAERVQSIAFSPDGKRLAVAGGSPARFGEIQVWDIATKRLKLSVSVTFDTVYGVSWSPDGSKIGFGCADNTVRAIDAENGEQVLMMGTHTDWVLDTAFSAKGDYLASVSRDMSMKLTEVATQRFIDNITSITPGALKGGLATVERRPMPKETMAKVPPDTPGAAPKVYDELLIAGSDGVPRIYKMHREVKRVIGDDANKVREFGAMPGRIFSARFNRDGTRFVVGSSLSGKGEVRVYQVEASAQPPIAAGTMVSRYEVPTGGVYAVAFHPDGTQIAAAGFDGIVRLIDPNTGKLIKEFGAAPLGPQK